MSSLETSDREAREFSGVHIRGVAETAKDEPAVARLTVQIWPLPYAVVRELNEHIRDMVNAWLTERHITSSTLTDLTGKGPMQ